MILLLDTSTYVCKIVIVDDKEEFSYEWQADRQLAKGLLSFIIDSLATHHHTLETLSGIGVRRGPGSFTGLRIGLTVLNTIARSLDIPIVGEIGDDWKQQAIKRLNEGENDEIVLPLYDRPANVTKPRK